MICLRRSSYNVSVKSVAFIYASGSGHTEWVVDHIASFLRSQLPGVSCTVVRAEQATAGSFNTADVIILGSGSWNTGGVEGQMHPHMFSFLTVTAKDVDLHEKPFGIIALGDDRYYYTARSGEHMRSFITSHNGTVPLLPLTIINDPYGQEERMEKWAKKLIDYLRS